MEFHDTDILVRYRVKDRPAGSQAAGQTIAGALPARPPDRAPFIRRVRRRRPVVIRRVRITQWPAASVAPAIR